MIELKEKTLGGKFKEYAGYALKDGFVVDQENREAMNRAFKIFAVGGMGLLFRGNPGSGKTIFFEILQRILNPKDPRQFVIKNVLDIVVDYNTNGHGVFKKYSNKNILFDDLGTEDKGDFYKDRIEVMSKFIEIRYAAYRQNRAVTHFSTNLTKDEILKRYGLRVKSRLDEISEEIILGKYDNYTDRRRYKNFIHYPSVHHEKILSDEEKKIEQEEEKIRLWYEVEKVKPHPKPKPTGFGQQIKESWGELKSSDK